MTHNEYKEYKELEEKLYKKGGGSIQYKWPVPENSDPDLKEYLRLKRVYGRNILKYEMEHKILTVQDLIDNG